MSAPMPFTARRSMTAILCAVFAQPLTIDEAQAAAEKHRRRMEELRLRAERSMGRRRKDDR